MKPSDLFVGSRQFFGYLVPGAIWAGIIWLLATEEPAELVRKATMIQVILFLSVSFVAGYMFQLLSFARVCALAERVGGRRSGPAGVPELEQVRAWLHTEGTMWFGPTPALTDERVAAFCKRWVLEKSEHLRNDIVELENEVNLLVALIPPLMAVPVVTVVVAIMLTLDTNSIAGALEAEAWILAGLSAITAMLLLRRLHSMRRDEITLWVSSFVDLQLAKKKTSPRPPALGTQGTPTS